MKTNWTKVTKYIENFNPGIKCQITRFKNCVERHKQFEVNT